jgi:hypothetical protein
VSTDEDEKKVDLRMDGRDLHSQSLVHYGVRSVNEFSDIEP